LSSLAGTAPAVRPAMPEAPTLDRVRALAHAALLDHARRHDPAHALSLLLRSLAKLTGAECSLAPRAPPGADPLAPLRARPPHWPAFVAPLPPAHEPTALAPPSSLPAHDLPWECSHSGTVVAELHAPRPLGLDRAEWGDRLGPALEAAAALAASWIEQSVPPGHATLALMRTAMHEAGTYVWEWDIASGTLGDIDEGERMLGYEPNTLGHTQSDWDRIVHPDDLAVIEEAYEAHARGEEPMYRAVYRARAADGQWRWIEERGRIVEHDRHGRPRRMFGTQTDATLLRELEQAQRERVEAQAASGAKTTLLSRISHELRTPLNAVLGFSQLLETDPLLAAMPEQRQQVQLIREAGEHLLAMIGDLLDLSLAESSHLPVTMQAVPLAPLFESCCTWIRSEAERAQVVVRIASLEGAATVRADPTRLRQVVTNLLSNAVKYNRRGGRVTLRATPAPGAWCIEVEDTGHGMSAAERARLFQPLNRLGREMGDVAGTGLGLALSQSLAHLMGGRITVRSIPGLGSTFSLVLQRV